MKQTHKNILILTPSFRKKERKKGSNHGPAATNFSFKLVLVLVVFVLVGCCGGGGGSHNQLNLFYQLG
jgi:hypothetical protein